MRCVHSLPVYYPTRLELSHRRRLSQCASLCPPKKTQVVKDTPQRESEKVVLPLIDSCVNLLSKAGVSGAP